MTILNCWVYLNFRKKAVGTRVIHTFPEFEH